MAASTELVNKSVQAAVSAIEIYNKPNFSYREEAFSILMLNAWELLLKAKWLVDRAERVESLYEMIQQPDGTLAPRLGRSRNPITTGVSVLAERISAETTSGMTPATRDNIFALVEIRDNSAHFVNKDLHFGRRVQEIGVASLRNYLALATDWFQVDLSQYNFFLMPISFYHGFEAATPVSLSAYSDQMRELLNYLDELESHNPENDEHTQHLSLRIQTSLIRAKGDESVAFRWTDDPSAPAVAVREEDVLKNYPWTYRELTQRCRDRYSDFVENSEYHDLRHQVEVERKFSIVRFLNPENSKSASQRFFNSNILQEFDKHYSRRKRD